MAWLWQSTIPIWTRLSHLCTPYSLSLLQFFIVSLRYPPDFSETLDPEHPLYSNAIEYIPVVDPQSPALRVRTTDPVFLERADSTVGGAAGLFDDDSDAEGDFVFLPNEVSNEEIADGGNEDGEDDESEESGAQAPVVTKKTRRRYCLEGCDCERARGSRACLCELRNDGMCADECQCDPTKCRTIAHAGEGEDASEEEVEGDE